MADKTQINLERIRACDAEWEESKHPRSENGQFTSGSGVKVSKATPAMKGGKFNNPKENIKKIGANALKEINKAGSTKQQFEASWKANEAIKKENDKRIAGAAALEKARPKIAAMRELAKAAQPAPKPNSANESVKSAVNKHIKQIKSVFAQYPDQAKNLSKDATDMFKKAEKAGALEKAAEFLKRKEKLDAEMVKQDKAGNRNEWYDGLSQEDKNLVSSSVTGVLAMATRKVEESNALREHLKKKEEHKANLLRKVIASENAKTPAAKPAKQKASSNKSVAALGGTDEEWKNSGMSKQEYANSHVAKNKAEVGGDIYSYLKNNKNDSIIVRTTYAGGGWHDVEFDAHQAGFDIYRVNSPDMASRREFSECYLFKRKKK